MLQLINKKNHYLINDNQEWLMIKIITSGFPVPKLLMIFWVDTAPHPHPHPHPHAVQRESSMWNDIFAMSMCYFSANTVYPKKYAHGFVVLCFVVVMQSFIMNSHEVFIHIHQGCFVGTGAIVRLPQCQWSKPDGYGKISQCITTTKHSKAKTVCIFLGIYCMCYFSANI